MSEPIQVRPAATSPDSIQLSDGDAAEIAHGRYLGALHDLVQDAADHERLHLLADVLAWTFARLAIHCGPGATADLLTKVGRYMGALEEQNRARRELEAAKEAGRLTN